MYAENFQHNMQHQRPVRSQTKGLIEIYGARIDNILERTSGKRKEIIEGVLRMPLVIMMFAWATLGPYTHNQLLDVPFLLCRYLGIGMWRLHVHTGFETLLPAYVELVVCFASSWLCQAVYWTIRSTEENVCFLDGLGIAFSDEYPSRKIIFLSAMIVRSIHVQCFINNKTHAFWVNISVTIITILSISTRWYVFIQLDYWCIQCLNILFIFDRCRRCSDAEMNRLQILMEETNVKMQFTTNERSGTILSERLQTYSKLFTMHKSQKFSWQTDLYVSNLCIVVFIFQIGIVALVTMHTDFAYPIASSLYSCVALCCYNIVSGIGLASMFSKILEYSMCLLTRFVLQSSQPNCSLLHFTVVHTMVAMYIDSSLFLLDVNARQSVLIIILMVPLSEAVLQIIGSVEYEILAIINEGSRGKVFKLFRILIVLAFILTAHLYISSRVAISSGLGRWTFVFLSRNIVVIVKMCFLCLNSVILFASRYPSCYQESLNNMFENMHAIANITVLLCMLLHSYTRLFAPNMGSLFLVRLVVIVIETVLSTMIMCFVEWSKYAVRNRLQGLINTLPDVIEDDQNDECSVCLTPLETGKQLPCSHAFHRDCLKRWFRVRTVCPLCNSTVQITDVDDRVGNAIRAFINNNQ